MIKKVKKLPLTKLDKANGVLAKVVCNNTKDGVQCRGAVEIRASVRSPLAPWTAMCTKCKKWYPKSVSPKELLL